MNLKNLNLKYALVNIGYMLLISGSMGFAFNYLSQVGFETGTIGTVMSIVSLAGVFLGPVAGDVVDRSDKITQRLFIVASMALCAVAGTVLLVLPAGSIVILPVVIVAFICAMIGMPMLNGMAFAYERFGGTINYGLCRGLGSAAFATVSLIVAYVGNYTAIGAEPVLNIASFVVIAGGIIGGALIEFFSAMLSDNTIESARLMADEGDRQLSVPGVLEGRVKPDYNRCIEMAAKQALRKMLAPSVLALFIPVIGGFLFGVEFVGGILIGATIVAIPRAIFMGNSGGAFDNAKKYIESGALKGHGKGSAAHKASVTGDTVGDTRKDVVGVALDIFIKTMSTVANTLAPIFIHFTLFK